MAAKANSHKLFTNSRSASYRACPRMHYYSYVQRYKALHENDSQIFGTCLHAMLEAYWLARQAGLDSEQRLYAGLDAMNHAMDPFQQAKAEAMFLAYTSIWDGIDVEVLAVEKTFQFPMLNPETGSKSRTWIMSGKLDLLVRFRGMFHGQDFTGIVAFVEHKTSSEDTSPGSAYRKKLGMDGQCGQYFEGADALASVYGYERVDRGIYDVLAKPQIVPKKATPVEDRKYVEARPATPEEPARLYEGQHDHDETPEEFAIRLQKAGGVLTAAGKKLKPFKATPIEKRKYTVAKPAQEAQPRRLHANMREFDETPEEFAQRCADKIIADLDGYFAQIEVTRTAEAREEYLFDVWQQGQLMHESEVKKRAPKNTDACFKYGSQCDFWPVCADGVRLDDPTRYRVKEMDSEELAETKAVLRAPMVVPNVTPAIRDRMEALEEADALARRKDAVAEVVAGGIEACHGEIVVEAKSEPHRTPEGRYVFDSKPVAVPGAETLVTPGTPAYENAISRASEDDAAIGPSDFVKGPRVECATCNGSSVVMGDGQEEPCPTCRPADHAARLVEMAADESAAESTTPHIHTNWTGRFCTGCAGKGCPRCGGTGEEHDVVRPEQCGDANCSSRIEAALSYRQRVIEMRVGRGLSQQLATNHTTTPAEQSPSEDVPDPDASVPVTVTTQRGPIIGRDFGVSMVVEIALPSVDKLLRQIDDAVTMPAASAPVSRGWGEKPSSYEPPAPGSSPYLQWGTAPAAVAPSRDESIAAVGILGPEDFGGSDFQETQPAVEPEHVCADCGRTINPDAECPHCVVLAAIPDGVVTTRSAIVYDEDSIPTF